MKVLLRPMLTLLKALFSERVFPWAAPVLLALSAWGFAQTDFGRQLEYMVVDSRMEMDNLGEQPVAPELLFVGIDNRSLDELGRWPWPRDEHARFLDALKEFPPRAIAYDILFIDHAGEADAELATASMTMGNVVFAAYAEEKRELLDRTNFDEERQINFTDFGFTEPMTRVTAGNVDEVLEHEVARLPVADITWGGPVGFANCEPDPEDGVRRRLPLVIKVYGDLYPSLTTQALMLYWGISSSDVEIRFGEALIFHLPDGPRSVPITDQGELIINWHRLDEFAERQQTVGFSNLMVGLADHRLNGTELPESLQSLDEKILIVGQSSTALTDVGPTPLQSKAFLPTVHLNAINTILTEEYIRQIEVEVVLVVWLLVAWLTAWGLRQRSFTAMVTIPVIILVGYVLTAYLIFVTDHILLPMVYPVAAFAVLHVGNGALRWWNEQRQREEIRSMFSTYVSDQLLEKLLSHPDSISLGGDVKAVTVFFSDIRSFTTISEGMTPAELVDQLNEYFGEMVDCVHRYGGTLHKYIGDAVMAVWGDLSEDSEEESSANAVRSSLEMVVKLQELNAGWVADGRLPWAVGIGLNHGEVLVGHIGAEERREFTVIGDVVNTASRIEGLTKGFKAELAIGESVRNLLPDSFLCRTLGMIVVKGKTKPVKVFEVFGEEGGTVESPVPRAWCERYEKAFALYVSREFEEARDLFTQCLEEKEGDHCSSRYREICEEFIRTPPPPDWEGVDVMTTK